MKEIVLENSALSHFPIDLHYQPSQNGAQLYSGCDVSVITGLILKEDAAYKRAVTGQNGDQKLPFSQLKMDDKFIYYYFIVVNQLYHLKIILTVNINFVLQDI